MQYRRNPRSRRSRRLTIEKLETRTLLSAGTLDPTFGDGGKVLTDFGVDFFVKDMAIQDDGKVVVGGYVTDPSAIAFARYNQDGSVDTAFGNNGLAIGPSGEGRGIAIQADGKIVVAGWQTGFVFTVVRFLADGALDDSFGSDGIAVADFGDYGLAYDVAIQPDGKIVAVGDVSGKFGFARFNPDGSPDVTFGTDGKSVADFAPHTGYPSAVAIQSDGGILAAGRTYSSEDYTFAVARCDLYGNLDGSFGEGGKVETDFGPLSTEAFAVIASPSGRIILAGILEDRGTAGNIGRFALAGYNANGTLDATFGDGGEVVTPGAWHGDMNETSAAFQPDGKILVAGSTHPSQGQDFVLARYRSDGDLDYSFGEGGVVTTDMTGYDDAEAVAFQSDGKIVVAGFTNTATDRLVALARYSAGDAAIDFGDAPDETGGYATRLVNDGARHIVTGGQSQSLRLGSQVDGEWDAQPDADATGDDLGGVDDEDGVALISTIVASGSVETGSAFLVTSSRGGMLDAWMDFDDNGVFDHPTEHLGSGESIELAQGDNIVPFEIPAGTTPGTKFARFRLSSPGGLAPGGLAEDGEVEDYVFEIVDADGGVEVQVNMPRMNTGSTGTGTTSTQSGTGTTWEPAAVVGLDGAALVVRSASKVVFQSPADVVTRLNLLGTPYYDAITLEPLASAFPGIAAINGQQRQDTLVLTGSGRALDLVSDESVMLASVETLDIRGSGPNSLTLDYSAVLSIAPDSNTLTVLADADDSVTIGAGWTLEGIEPTWPDTRLRYRQNDLVLKVLNRPPSDIALSSSVIHENSPISTMVGRVTVTDPDVDDTLNIVLQDDADGRFGLIGRSLVVADGTLLDFESQQVHSVRVRVTDAAGRILDKCFDVSVLDVNEAPTVAMAISDAVAMENVPFGFAFDQDTFHDVDAGDVLSYTATLQDGSPLPAWVHFAGSTRTFSGRPTFDDAGQYRFLVRATDSSQPPLAAETSFVLTVVENPRPWQNPLNPLDVDDSATQHEPFALDVLNVVNFINAHDAMQLPSPPSPFGPIPYVDVDGNGTVSPEDVVLLINVINAETDGSQPTGGEGEHVYSAAVFLPPSSPGSFAEARLATPCAPLASTGSAAHGAGQRDAATTMPGGWSQRIYVAARGGLASPTSTLPALRLLAQPLASDWPAPNGLDSLTTWQ